MARRRWSDLTVGQQRAVYVAGAVEIALTTVALRDLTRRSPAQVRGPRWVWMLGCFVQPVGPLAYLAAGRRSGASRRR